MFAFFFILITVKKTKENPLCRYQIGCGCYLTAARNFKVDCLFHVTQCMTINQATLNVRMTTYHANG